MYGGAKAQLHAFLILVIFTELLHTCGYAVAHLVKALLYKVAASISDGVIGIFIYLIIPADNLTTFICRSSRNSGSLSLL
jgi:hypothetical protein